VKFIPSHVPFIAISKARVKQQYLLYIRPHNMVNFGPKRLTSFR